MAPVSPTTTNRLRLTYTGPFGTHTMVFHGRVGSTQSGLRAAVVAVVAAMTGFQWNTTVWDKAEYAPAGSNIFNIDTAWSTIVATNGNNPTAASAPSGFAQFGGRGNGDGVRAKWYLFEDVADSNATMRIQAGDNATIAGVISALEDNSAVIGNIAGSLLSIYQYANLGQNDYLTHKARR